MNLRAKGSGTVQQADHGNDLQAYPRRPEPLADPIVTHTSDDPVSVIDG
jgi:hypothetical protein